MGAKVGFGGYPRSEPMPRFLLTPRWLAGHVVIASIVGACVVAGLWQLDRLRGRQESNARIEAQLARPAILLGTGVVPGSLGQPGDVAGVAYRRIRVSGTYDVRREVVLIGRTLEGRPGNHLLTPLMLGDGWGLLVDRGWVPYGLQDPPVAEARPPPGTVHLTGVLLPAATARGAGAGAKAGPADRLATVDIGRLQAQVPYRLSPVYLWLQSQAPPQDGTMPWTVPLPSPGEGPHLGYAIQWFTFAAIGLIGYPLLLRREIARRGPAGGPEAGS